MVADEYDDEESRPGFIRRLFRTLFLAAFLIIVGLCGWTIYAYQDMTGKPPWEWDGFQWLGWWKYTVSLGREVGTEVAEKSREAGATAVEYGKNAVQKVKDIEWSKLGDTITEKTKSLFGKSNEVVKKIEEQRRQTDSGYAQKYPGPPGEAYDFGLQAMEEGIRYFQVSLQEGASGQKLDPKATEQSVKRFRMAVSNFETAKSLKPDLPDIDNFLNQAKEYLAESEERQKKIEEILKHPPAAPTAAAPASGTPAAAPATTPAAANP
jgi:hypothetical protein